VIADLALETLAFGNRILLSANVIIGFSLFAYVVANNFGSRVARAFCALIAFVTVVYVVDLNIDQVSSITAAEIWLRVQWVGIAFVPAAYLHFSESVLHSTGHTSRWRQAVVLSAYGLGLVALVLAIFTDAIVRDFAEKDGMYYLLPGPVFWGFSAYYVLATAYGWRNILRARARTLTTDARRRLSYLKWAFAAPGIGVFPYLLIPTTARLLSVTFVNVLTLVGNMATAIMLVIIGYIVAYQGMLLPDRVVKHRMLHYLLRGPLVAILVVFVMLAVPKTDHIMGLPRDTVLVLAVVSSIVILQLAVNLAKPAIDRLAYWRDRKEIERIHSLDERLLTSTDLEQILESTLVSLCEMLRVPSGFVITMENATPSLRVFCGERGEAAPFLHRASFPQLLEILAPCRRDELLEPDDFVVADGYWLLPLRARSDTLTLGILGVRYLGAKPEFEESDLEIIYTLVRRAETALEDMLLQQRIFDVLTSLESEVDDLQQWRSMPKYAGSETLQHFEMNPVQSPGFPQAVKDALSHYWGGPKLSQSPLVRMRIVASRLAEGDSVPAKAVRAVLKQAIEMLRPAGERSMGSGEWVVYNILDLRYVQGQRIRDITQRLAMSESDYYRKQRVAIEQVAETLSQMELTFAERWPENSEPDSRED